MLTKITIRNLKRFDDVDIELGNPVVFIGPNDSGKTTALQALALWEVGLKRWQEKNADKQGKSSKRSGVTISRQDLIAIPVPSIDLLWRNLRVRDSGMVEGKQTNKNILVEIIVEGITGTQEWKCGLEFDFANDEFLYCRPLRLSNDKNPPRMAVPPEAVNESIAFLPPMSGLTSREDKLDKGAINVRLGEGRTAEVLRNRCYQVEADRWEGLVARMKTLFGVTLNRPVVIDSRGEITMTYQTREEITLDIASSGRGMLQMLLLLAHLEVNPGSVVLLDEPDAHLEILRQREMYNVLCDAARERHCQIIMASHSEVILNEAADRDVVVAFIGKKPHRIDDRGSQLMKALKEVGWDQFYQAEIKGWVLYLEGSTDLAILQAFARRLQHPAEAVLANAFVHYICSNQPQKARDHFNALKEAKTDLRGYVLCDRIDKKLQPTEACPERMWQRRELENYLCQPQTLLCYAENDGFGQEVNLIDHAERHRRKEAMAESIRNNLIPAMVENPDHPRWRDFKASDDFLDEVFAGYARNLGISAALLRKTDYHILAEYVPLELISPEITEVLDEIYAASQRAQPTP